MTRLSVEVVQSAERWFFRPEETAAHHERAIGDAEMEIGVRVLREAYKHPVLVTALREPLCDHVLRTRGDVITADLKTIPPEVARQTICFSPRLPCVASEPQAKDLSFRARAKAWFNWAFPEIVYDGPKG